MNKHESLGTLVLAVITIVSLVLTPLHEQAEAPGSGADLVEQRSSVVVLTSTPTLRPTWTRLPTQTATASPTATELPETSTPHPTSTPSMTPSTTPSPTATVFPFDTHTDLAKFVYIDQDIQHMYVFEWGRLVRDIPCSTGLPNDDTYTEPWSGAIGQYWASFFAFDVYADDAWYLYKSLGGILIHSLPYTKENGYKVYQDRDKLGVEPSSHGCIRISPEDAAWFTAWEPQGALCTVTEPYREKWWYLRDTPTP